MGTRHGWWKWLAAAGLGAVLATVAILATRPAAPPAPSDQAQPADAQTQPYSAALPSDEQRKQEQNLWNEAARRMNSKEAQQRDRDRIAASQDGFDPETLTPDLTFPPYDDPWLFAQGVARVVNSINYAATDRDEWIAAIEDQVGAELPGVTDGTIETPASAVALVAEKLAPSPETWDARAADGVVEVLGIDRTLELNRDQLTGLWEEHHSNGPGTADDMLTAGGHFLVVDGTRTSYADGAAVSQVTIRAIVSLRCPTRSSSTTATSAVDHPCEVAVISVSSRPAADR